MTRLFTASREQQVAIADIVERDAALVFFGGLDEVLERLMASIELMVHSDVHGPLPQSLAHGLPQSPRQNASSDDVVFLSGAREVGMEVATCLTEILGIDNKKVLYIPHAYAKPDEIDSLQDEFDGLVLEVAGRVYVRAAGPEVQPESICRALASMICGYSVGWLLNGDFPAKWPCSAVVPIFDGEGWAVAGSSILHPMQKH